METCMWIIEYRVRINPVYDGPFMVGFHWGASGKLCLWPHVLPEQVGGVCTPPVCSRFPRCGLSCKLKWVLFQSLAAINRQDEAICSETVSLAVRLDDSVFSRPSAASRTGPFGGLAQTIGNKPAPAVGEGQRGAEGPGCFSLGFEGNGCSEASPLYLQQAWVLKTN